MTTRYFETNYYIWGNQGKVQDLNSLQAQVCFLFSCNLRTESLLLNTKLRSYYVSKGLKFYSFSNFFKGTFPVAFCSININKLFLILKNKLRFGTKVFRSKDFILIFGHSLLTRVRQFWVLQNFLKHQLPSSALFFTLKLSSNSEGLDFYKILSVNSNVLKKKIKLISFEIDDTIQSRKILNSYGFKSFSGTSFSTSKIDWSYHTFSLLTLYETGGLFLNFEKIPKIANPLPYRGLNTTLSPFALLLGMSEIYNSVTTFSDHINIGLQTFLNYAKKQETISFSNIMYNYMYFSRTVWSNQFVFFSKYPQKSLIEDFYRTNIFTKNSKLLSEASRSFRTFN
jgi:hypothetical protein